MLTEDQIAKLKTIHRDLDSDVWDNDPEARGPSASSVGARLLELIEVLGGFCGMCSGSGQTWRGECECQKSKGV